VNKLKAGKMQSRVILEEISRKMKDSPSKTRDQYIMVIGVRAG
jgi:hypothetical protein